MDEHIARRVTIFSYLFGSAITGNPITTSPRMIQSKSETRLLFPWGPMERSESLKS